MKKFYVFILLFLVVITGCNKDSKNFDNNEVIKTMTCSLSMVQDDVDYDFKYLITYKEGYVLSLHSEEIIKTSIKEKISSFIEVIHENYDLYKNVEYYNTNLIIENNKLISIIDIDYTKINIDKLIDIDPLNETLFSSGKIKINDIRKTYETLGAVCKNN